MYDEIEIIVKDIDIITLKELEKNINERIEE